MKKYHKLIVAIDIILLIGITLFSVMIQVNNDKTTSHNSNIIQDENKLAYLSGLISAEYSRVIIANQEANQADKADAASKLKIYVDDYNNIKDRSLNPKLIDSPSCFLTKCERENKIIYVLQIITVCVLIILNSIRLREVEAKKTQS